MTIGRRGLGSHEKDLKALLEFQNENELLKTRISTLEAELAAANARIEELEVFGEGDDEDSDDEDGDEDDDDDEDEDEDAWSDSEDSDDAGDEEDEKTQR